MGPKPCKCEDGELCWRCTPYGRDPRDPEWPAREAARILLEALQANPVTAPLAQKGQ